MTWTAEIFDVFIASPSDVVEERRVIDRVLDRWNSIYSKDRSVVLRPVRWDTHTRPILERKPRRAQGLITEKLVKNADMLISIFRQKVGSNTGIYESGTVEEIEEFRQLGRPLLIYFFDTPPDQVVESSSVIDRLDPSYRQKKRENKELHVEQLAEFENLKKLRQRYEQQGLVGSYKSIAELKDRLGADFARVAVEEFNSLSGAS